MGDQFVGYGEGVSFYREAINSISNGRKPIPREKFVSKLYDPYNMLTCLNRDISLSHHLIPFNKKEARDVDPYCHYLTLFYTIPKSYRKFEWVEKSQTTHNKNHVGVISAYFNVREDIAIEYLDFLTEEQAEEFYKYCKRVGFYE